MFARGAVIVVLVGVLPVAAAQQLDRDGVRLVQEAVGLDLRLHSVQTGGGDRLRRAFALIEDSDELLGVVSGYMLIILSVFALAGAAAADPAGGDGRRRGRRRGGGGRGGGDGRDVPGWPEQVGSPAPTTPRACSPGSAVVGAGVAGRSGPSGTTPAPGDRRPAADAGPDRAAGRGGPVRGPGAGGGRDCRLAAAAAGRRRRGGGGGGGRRVAAARCRRFGRRSRRGGRGAGWGGRGGRGAGASAGRSRRRTATGRSGMGVGHERGFGAAGFRTYGGWARPTSPGIGPLKLIPTMRLMGGLVVVLLTAMLCGLGAALLVAVLLGLAGAPAVVPWRGRPAVCGVDPAVGVAAARAHGPPSVPVGLGGGDPGRDAAAARGAGAGAAVGGAGLVGPPVRAGGSPAARQWAVVMRAAAQAGALVDPDTRDVWVAGWGEWLAQLGQESGVVQAAVVVETAPDAGRAAGRARGGAGPPGHPGFARAVLADCGRRAADRGGRDVGLRDADVLRAGNRGHPRPGRPGRGAGAPPRRSAAGCPG